MSILDGLNDRQREAAGHIDGPLLIIAGAGSGKTRVLTHRVAYLIKECNVDPYNIMAITFTNKAAGEMRERVDKIVGSGCEAVWVMTFHATCVRILRRHIHEIGYDNNFTIYDTDDTKAAMREVYKKLQFDPKQLREATVLREISNAKNELIGPDRFMSENAGDYRMAQIGKAYDLYQDILRNNNALDFDDLIRLTVSLFERCPEVLANYQDRFRYIMVDEYQDTNNAQFELIKLLAAKHRNLCVVGDDDQSIYKFRGANIKNILNFESNFSGAKVIKLEQNYRSTQNILNAANSVIAHNYGRKPKKLWTDRDGGDPVYFRVYGNGREEARDVAEQIIRLKRRGIADFGDCAILYRTNAQSREFEEQLVREGVPYFIIGSVNFYSRREIKDLLSYLKTIENAQDDLAVARIINVPKRGIGATTIQKVMDFADGNNMCFYDACTMADQVPGLGKAAAKIEKFTSFISNMRDVLAQAGMTAALKEIIDETGFIEEIKKADEDDAEDRIGNIEELISTVRQYEDTHPEATLADFLEEAALVSDLDSADEETSRVLLMTIHSAKGLEFPHVFLCGMEDGVFPGFMSINSGNEEDIEEERRLAYVAITRAKDVLNISAAKSRMVRGETQYLPVSRFIKEIPENLMETDSDEGSFSFGGGSSYGGSASYNRSSYRESSYGNSYRTRDDSGFGNRVPDSSKVAENKLLKKNAAAFLGVKSKTESQTASSPQKSAAGAFTRGADISFGAPDYGPGDRVRHVKFGDGTVKAVDKGPRDYQVTVEFDGVGQKIMYAAFAKLIKI